MKAKSLLEGIANEEHLCHLLTIGEDGQRLLRLGNGCHPPSQTLVHVNISIYLPTYLFDDRTNIFKRTLMFSTYVLFF